MSPMPGTDGTPRVLIVTHILNEDSGKGSFKMLLAVLLVVLILGGSGGFYGHSRWGFGGGAGMGLGTALVAVVLVYMLGLFPAR